MVVEPAVRWDRHRDHHDFPMRIDSDPCTARGGGTWVLGDANLGRVCVCVFFLLVLCGFGVFLLPSVGLGARHDYQTLSPRFI